MPAIDTLATGLAGAIGCHYHGASNRLYFVEYGGKLSCYDFVRQPAALLLSNAARTLKGTWLMDLDTGAMVAGVAPADIWWEQIDTVRRRMVPRNGARIAFLGVMTATQFNALNAEQLQALSYGSTPIVGDDNAANQLVAGAVFAVTTNGGNVSKVRVTTYGYDIKLRITTWRLNPAYRVLGTGYLEPEDVKVSANGMTAYITERGGRLLRVALVGVAPPNRAMASVVASGLAMPHQISLHEDRGLAYVVEYGVPGHLVRIDLASGSKTNIGFGLERAIGLLITSDHKQAYVSEQAASGGRVRRISLDSGTAEAVLGGFTAPFMMAFNDAAESAILMAERDPANRVTLIDLGARPVVSRVVAAPVPVRPSSVAVVAGSRVLVCSDTVLSSTELAAGLLTGTGPILLGVGHVPVDRIDGGYADTSGDPGYFFQVKHAPFGGALPLMFNHECARALGATLYKVLVDGVETHVPWGDYRWSAALNRFDYVAVTPNAAGFYPVRAAGELWYNAWLGLVRDTADLADGDHTVEFRLFRPTLVPIATPGLTSSVLLRIDNAVPTATIHTISQAGTPVGNCGIVTSGADNFQFEITAFDPQQHLLSWSLVALWGDNQSKLVAEDSYANHVSPSKQWGGLAVANVPAGGWASFVPGDPTSKRCAHTFVLNVWDRVINGWGYIHQSSAHRSITIMLP
jgi:hypothetical protein